MNLLLFPLPPSVFVVTMSVLSLPSSALAGFKEARGINLQYSKFWNANNNFQEKSAEIKLSSRTGMLVLYTPSFLAGLLSLVLFYNEGTRSILVDSALTLHFFKRVLEVLFVHQYSGRMALNTIIPITVSYFLTTTVMIYNQHLTTGLPEPQLDLKWVGVFLFLLGILGNFYHHRLLAKLREKNDKRYKIPKGGMFNLVICPHYLFEILGFVGIGFISQTVYSVLSAIGMSLYLMGRSYATRKWYLSKFPNFPHKVKRLIPYVF